MSVKTQDRDQARVNKRKGGKTNEAPAVSDGAVQAYLLHPKRLKLDHGGFIQWTTLTKSASWG
jgi:hypothetical protein